jgi:hypothetical protein
VLSGRGLCDELITRPEESYRLWCVDVCDLEYFKNEEAMTRVGQQRHTKKKHTHEVRYIEHDVSDTKEDILSVSELLTHATRSKIFKILSGFIEEKDLGIEKLRWSLYLRRCLSYS